LKFPHNEKDDILIDTHTHIDLISDDKSVQDEIVREAEAAGISLMINIGVDTERLKSCPELSERHASVFHTAGYHPEILNEKGQQIEIALLKQALSHPKCIGIGEIGLDYHHNSQNKQDQERLFLQQIEISMETALPMALHIRDAWEDAFQLLSPYKGKVQGIFHCFTGGKEEAKQCLDLGFYISFSGILTYKNADTIREAALYAPIDRTFLETDAPFLAPVPMRGKPNRPSYVKYIYDSYAQLTAKPCDHIVRTHRENLDKLFPKLGLNGFKP
jgi:TatD DNase family protein